MKLALFSASIHQSLESPIERSPFRRTTRIRHTPLASTVGLVYKASSRHSKVVTISLTLKMSKRSAQYRTSSAVARDTNCPLPVSLPTIIPFIDAANGRQPVPLFSCTSSLKTCTEYHFIRVSDRRQVRTTSHRIGLLCKLQCLVNRLVAVFDCRRQIKGNRHRRRR